jgi:RNA polymerase sigma-70 factor (ECF subfamily)
MDEHDSQDRLSRLKTHWTLVFQAHQGAADEATRAQQQLVLRYYGAIYRYLLGMLGDAVAAEELTQDFALALLRGDFSKADPDKGRFRDYLKTSVRHLAHKHWNRRRQARESPLQDEALLVAPSEPPPFEADAVFLDGWREELLARTWEELRRVEDETGAPHHTLLSLKTQCPELRSAGLAERAAPRLGKTLTADGVRQAVHRAREVFPRLLIEEVSRTLTDRAPDALEQELIDLGLLAYCQPMLNRRSNRT